MDLFVRMSASHGTHEQLMLSNEQPLGLLCSVDMSFTSPWCVCVREQIPAPWIGPQSTEIAIFLRLRLQNFHPRPEIAEISGSLLNKETLRFKAAIFPIASDCDFTLRTPSENRVLSGESPCDLTPAKEDCDRSDSDLRFWCAQDRSLLLNLSTLAVSINQRK